MLYIIASDLDGPIKIGQSQNPQKRLQQMRTASPFDLKIICKFYAADENDNPICDRVAEKFLHDSFSNFNIRREWFDLSFHDFYHVINGNTFYLYDTFDNQNEYSIIRFDYFELNHDMLESYLYAIDDDEHGWYVRCPESLEKTKEKLALIDPSMIKIGPRKKWFHSCRCC